MAQGFHPFPSRTLKSSPAAPMVLQLDCWRAGRCQAFFVLQAGQPFTLSFSMRPRQVPASYPPDSRMSIGPGVRIRCAGCSTRDFPPSRRSTATLCLRFQQVPPPPHHPRSIRIPPLRRLEPRYRQNSLPGLRLRHFPTLLLQEFFPFALMRSATHPAAGGVPLRRSASAPAPSTIRLDDPPGSARLPATPRGAVRRF
jgi:hypothetical protein